MTSGQLTPTDQTEHRYVLTLGCPDRTGIVARISTFLTEVGGWITEAAYHSDADTGWFFTRHAIRADTVSLGAGELRARFAAEVAAELGPETEWRLTDTRDTKSVVLLVSKETHCLIDLLGRAHRGELPATIRAVVGNHPQLEELAAATRRAPAAKTDAELLQARWHATGLERARDLLREVLNAGPPASAVEPRKLAAVADPVCSRCLRRQSRHGAGGRDAECPDGFVARAD